MDLLQGSLGKAETVHVLLDSDLAPGIERMLNDRSKASHASQQLIPLVTIGGFAGHTRIVRELRRQVPLCVLPVAHELGFHDRGVHVKGGQCIEQVARRSQSDALVQAAGH